MSHRHLTGVLFALATALPALPAQSEPPVPTRVLARVVDLQGRPVAGAGLAVGDRDRITAADALAAPLARTDDQGNLRAVLPAVPPEQGARRLALLVAPGRSCLVLTVSGEITGTGADRHRRVDLGTVILRAGVDVRGLVRSTDGKPVAGARVLATDVFRASHLRIGIDDDCRSFATTDAKGRFELIGIPPRGVSVTIRAAGYHDHEDRYRNRYTPLVAALEPSGVTTGVVVGDDGKPVPQAEVRGYFEGSESVVTATADAEGRFAMPLRYRGRYRLATGTGSNKVFLNWSETRSAPAQDVKLTIPRPTGVEVRAQGPDGKPLTEFTAAIVWVDPRLWGARPDYLESVFGSLARSADAGGRLSIPGPSNGQPPTGRMLLKAAGCAPKASDIEWDPAKPARLEVKLEPESAITGVVRDESGRPLPHARVFAVVPGPTRGTNPFATNPVPSRRGGVTADEAGRFRIGGLGAMSYLVSAELAGRPPSRTSQVALKPGQVREDLVLTCPPGATLKGRIVASELRPGWLVGPTPRSADAFQIMLPISVPPAEGEPSTKGAVPLDQEGRFVVRGLADGTHRFSVLIPYPLGTLAIPLPDVAIRGADVKREFPIGTEAPGALTGTVEASGAPLPPGRVMVLATRVDGQNRQGFTLGTVLVGSRGMLGQDGRFTVPVREGKHRLRLVDLATGITLYQAPALARVQSAERKVVDIKAPLAMLTVRLTPNAEGGWLLPTHLEIRVAHPAVDQGNQPVFRLDQTNYDTGVGVGLQPGQRDVTVIVPGLDTRILVRSAAHQLEPAQSKYTLPPVGDASLLPECGKPNRIEVRVEPPGL